MADLEPGALRKVWESCHASVGMLFKGDEAVGTAWCVSHKPAMLMTAGHNLMGLLDPWIRALANGGSLQDVSVLFAPDAQSGGERIKVTGYAMAHPLWDFCLLELAHTNGLPPPLAVVRAMTAGGTDTFVTTKAIAVIGYPAPADNTTEAGVFTDRWHRHISPGQVIWGSQLGYDLAHAQDEDSVFRRDMRRPLVALATHDASTCPGFSGGPVIDLESGLVLGVHVRGSNENVDQVRYDWNDAVDLAAARAEPWVAAFLDSGTANGLKSAYSIHNPDWEGGVANETTFGSRAARHERFARRAHQGGFAGGVIPDRPDFRDRIFVPSLARPKREFLPEKAPAIGDQGHGATCAAHAVAAAIVPQLRRRKRDRSEMIVSVAMLDAMARDHDEFLDDDGSGTTLRGVLKGFFNNGVCRATLDATDPDAPFLLTRHMAKDARTITLGAYFRVPATLSDMQMAVQEAGAVVVSAYIHAGWNPPLGPGQKACPVTVIPFTDPDDAPPIGAHAFVITGYTADGFIVQNSWGRGWGAWKNRPGHALWRYADWAANMIDAWVVRLQAPTPAGFGHIAQAAQGADPVPRRAHLLGHMIQTERDGLVERGTLGLGARGLAETVAFLSGAGTAEDRKAARAYSRIGLVFHDPLMEPDRIARIAARMTPRMKAHGTYALHLSYGLDEMRTLKLRLGDDAERIRKGFEGIDAPPAQYLERQVARTAQRLVEDFRAGIDQAANGCLGRVLAQVLSGAVLGPAKFLPNGRDLCVLGVGLGAATMTGIAGLLAPGTRRIALAAPTLHPPGTTIWRLGPDRSATEVPGYAGSWNDLLAVVLTEGAAPRARQTIDGDPASTMGNLAQALTDRALIAQLCA